MAIDSRLNRAVPALVAAAVTGACLFFLTVEDASFDRYQLPKELALLACAALLAFPLAQRARPDRLDALAAFAVGWTLLASLFAGTFGLAERSLALSASAAVLFLGARRLEPEERLLPWAACVAAPAAVAALALGESFGLVTGLSSSGRAPGSALGQRNEVAHLAVLASPAAWALAATTRGRQRAFALGAAVLFAAAIVQTRSRAAWVVGPPALLVWLLLEWRRARSVRPVAAVGAAALLAAAASALAPSALHWRSRTPLQDTLARLVDTTRGSGHGRVVQAQASLALFREHPALGLGPGHWMVEYPRVRPHRDPTFDPERMLPTGRFPNADALAFLVERGAPFFLAVLALFALALHALWRRAAQGGDPLAPAAAAALVAAAGLSFLDAVLHLAPAAALLAAVAGLALPGAPRASPSPRAAGVAAVLVLLLGAGAVRAGNRLAGLWVESRSDAGLEGLERALQWAPADVEARTRLAEALVLDRDCARARPHLEWLAGALPHHPSVKRLRAGCPKPGWE